MIRGAQYLVIVFLIGGMFYFWGFRQGVSSVEVRDNVRVEFRTLPPIRTVVAEPVPVIIREPADTVWRTLPADTAAIIADYLRDREYRLDFSSDTTGTFLVAATVGRNRLLNAEATIQPLIREVTTVRTVCKTTPFNPRWEVGLEVICNSRYQGAGVSIRRDFGLFSLSGVAGYDPIGKEPVFELRGAMPLWRSRTTTN